MLRLWVRREQVFGENGKNYFRLTGFGTRENTIEAMERIDKLI